MTSRSVVSVSFHLTSFYICQVITDSRKLKEMVEGDFQWHEVHTKFYKNRQIT